MKKTTHGGARKGAGRKPKPPTKTISVRVPAALYEVLKAVIHKLVQKHIKA